MPSNFWIAGWVVAGVLAALLYGEKVTNGFSFSSTKAQQENKNGQTQQRIAKGNRPPSLTFKREPPPREYQADCSKREDSDLCAQRRAAAAAEEQSRLNWIGLVLLGGTLGFTGWAAWSARRAAIATVQSATASRDLLDLAHPPKIIVALVAANPVGRRDDPIILAAGEEIEGVVAVISAGRGIARITQQFCLPYWHSGQLPMWRPYDGVTKKGLPHFGRLTVESRPGAAVTDLASGEMAVWKFTYKIPATYVSGQAFYILGQIAYGDPVAHGWHTVLFARKYDPGKNRFLPVDDPNSENAY